MKITVVGTGHQGLVTGTCLAETGHQVVCMDRDADRVARLRAGEVPIHEP
ncbi:MAG TPA: 2-dehydropantoate 2-reductase N-terminal domain-containing protein, partial [Candidatus Hydrogenedentes bacterium]|nr:2-dehydropantoate 2-reductase N-terminal domain-containing protein [Candidatus Hydrogenedentota bacterium]